MTLIMSREELYKKRALHLLPSCFILIPKLYIDRTKGKHPMSLFLA